MHKLVNALMSWFLWQPPARLMRQVTFPIKMVIIATAVAVSLVWLLWVMVGGKLQGIDATTQELAGVRYASAIYPAMDLAGVWRQQSRNAAFGEGGDQLPQARQAFDLAFKKLQAMDAELGQSLQVSSSFAALRSAVQAAQAVQPSAGVKADPEVVYQGMIGVSRTLADLLDAVTDGSGLVLDPDLASYHLMSAVLLRAPDVIQTTVEIRGLVRTALKAGQITPDNAARLEGYLATLARDTAQAKFSLDKVQKAAPFYGQKLIRGAVIATEEFLESVRVNVPVEASTVQGDAAAFVKLANQTLQSQFKQVEGNLNVLEAMLVDRQSALRQDLWLALAITALSQLVAAYFGMGFFVAMQNGFTTLRHHLITISMGDLRGIIEVSGHDEMSAMLKELGNMQLALSQTVQQVQQASDDAVQSRNCAGHDRLVCTYRVGCCCFGTIVSRIGANQCHRGHDRRVGCQGIPNCQQQRQHCESGRRGDARRGRHHGAYPCLVTKNQRHHWGHRRHCVSNQHPGAQRRSGSGARGRAGAWFCGGGRRSAGASRAQCSSG